MLRRKTAGKTAVALVIAIHLLLAGEVKAALLGDTIKPFASVSETYDSNVFRVRDKEQLKALVNDDSMSDFINTATVGSLFHYGLNSLESNILVKRDFITYSHYDSQSSNRDELRGDAAIRFFDRLKLKVDASYLKEPQARSDFRSSARNDMTTLQYAVLVGYEMTSGFGFEAGYRRVGVDYSLAGFRPNEYDLDRYSGTVYYRISPETKVYTTYQRDNRNYREGILEGNVTVKNTNSGDTVRVGIEKAISPRTSVIGNVGYTTRVHSALSGRDFSGMTGKAEIRYGVTSKLGVVVNGEREIYEETYRDQPYSINTSAGTGVVYQATEKVTASIMNKVTWKDLQNLPGTSAPKRKDFTTGVNAGVEWKPLDRLSVNVGYQFENRHSNDSTFKYSSHAVTTGVAYKF